MSFVLLEFGRIVRTNHHRPNFKGDLQCFFLSLSFGVLHKFLCLYKGSLKGKKGKENTAPDVPETACQ